MTIRDIPSIPERNVDPELRRALVRIREVLQDFMGVRGDGTFRDALAANLGGGGTTVIVQPGTPGGGGGGDPDLTPPPVPSDFTASAGFSNVIAEWTGITYTQGRGHKQTNIYGVQRDPASTAPPPVFGDASIVTVAPNALTLATFASELNTRWHLWATFVTNDGVEGAPAGGTNGVVVQTAVDIDQLLDALAGAITASELSAALNDRIDLIDGPSTLAGSVAARILAEQNLRQLADDAIISDLDVLGIQVGNNAAAIANEATLRIEGDSAQATALSAVAARINTRPNLLPNGGFSNGLTGWTGTLLSFMSIIDNVWGRIAFSSTFSGGVGDFVSAPFQVQAGDWYTVHGDALLFASAGSAYFDILFYNSAGAVVGDGPQNPKSASFDFSTTDSNRSAMAVESQAPATAVTARARFVVSGAAGVTAMGCRLIKVERGRLPYTAYSPEGETQAAFAAVASEQTARVNADNALAGSITSLTATVSGNNSTLTAAINSEATTRANADTALSNQITTLTSSVGANSAAIATEATTRATVDGYLGAQYTVRAQITQDGRTVVGGFGLSATNAGDAGATIDFGVVANRFWVAAPTGNPGVADMRPFVIQATPTTINGVAVPVGVYMDAAYILNGSITNAKIGNAVIDDAKVSTLSAAKFTGGEMRVGSFLQSTDWSGGSGGFRIGADGNATFRNGVFNGTINAVAGSIGGVTINAGDIRSNYVPGTSGIRISGSTGYLEAMSGVIGNLVMDSTGLRSANYAAGSAGLRLNAADGSAEFNNIVLRGSAGAVGVDDEVDEVQFVGLGGTLAGGGYSNLQTANSTGYLIDNPTPGGPQLAVGGRVIATCTTPYSGQRVRASCTGYVDVSFVANWGGPPEATHTMQFDFELRLYRVTSGSTVVLEKTSRQRIRDITYLDVTTGRAVPFNLHTVLNAAPAATYVAVLYVSVLALQGGGTAALYCMSQPNTLLTWDAGLVGDAI